MRWKRKQHKQQPARKQRLAHVNHQDQTIRLWIVNQEYIENEMCQWMQQTKERNKL